MLIFDVQQVFFNQVILGMLVISFFVAAGFDFAGLGTAVILNYSSKKYPRNCRGYLLKKFKKKISLSFVQLFHERFFFTARDLDLRPIAHDGIAAVFL